MRKVMAVALLVFGIACVASADEVYFSFHCDGSGNMVLDSPVIYEGPITSGDLAPGYWRINVDDTGWPPPSDPAARWAYIWDNYYVYDPFTYLWTAHFPQDHCGLYLERTGVGSMCGVCDMTFQIVDFDWDGELDPEECAADGLSGMIIIINEGTGAYQHLCGNGTYAGDYTRDCDETSPTWMQDDVSFDMELVLEECGMAIKPTTWGSIKALFE